MKQDSKVVFLTSSPDDSYQIEGEWVTGPFTRKNRFLEQVSRVWPRRAHVLVITAAPDADAQNGEMMGYLETVFAESGLDVEELGLLDSHTAGYAAAWVEESSVLILGGGHVPTQNAFFQRIGLRQLLERFSGVIIGISAGTMNCADLVYAQPELPGEPRDPCYRRYLPGLGLTRTQVLPHYDKVKHEKLDGLWIIDDISVPDSRGREFLALPDGSYVLCQDGRETVYGRAYRIADGRLNQICGDGEAAVLTSGQEEPAHSPETSGAEGTHTPAAGQPPEDAQIRLCLENLQKAGVRPEVCSLVMEAAQNVRTNCNICCTRLEEGLVRAQLVIGPEHRNPLGLVYGGILYNLADLVCGMAFMTVGRFGPTISGDMQFISGTGDTGTVICESRVVKNGNRIAFIQADIFDEDGKLLARGNYTFCNSYYSRGASSCPA